MYIDYRNLNKATMKNKFFIHITWKLLDVLYRTKYFSKIDLKSVYHQIRVSPQDIDKTAFKIHFGHFEYLLMPFGLTNAPSTFKSLMNRAFKPLLRKGCWYILMLFSFTSLLGMDTCFTCTWSYKLCRKIRYMPIWESVHFEYLKFTSWDMWFLQKEFILSEINCFYLGLACTYYSKIVEGFPGINMILFIKNYESKCRPLTLLLRKDAFS